MKKSTRTILEELNRVNVRNTNIVIETRGTNIIESVINLLETIHENYDIETAHDLEKRIINSIKTRDANKFSRGVKKIK